MRLTWLLGILALLALGCSSGESADQTTVSTEAPATEIAKSEQLAIGSITEANLSDPARRAKNPGPPAPSGDITFDMQEEYRLGETVEVVLRNDSNVDYYYQFQYPACYNLQFFDDSQESRPYPNADPVLKQRYLSPGQFIVPRGTHCDIIGERSLEPGQSIYLFTWKQQMCIKDRWGCMESVPVEPGEYLIRGGFSRVERAAGSIPPSVFDGNQKPDVITTITWSFTILPP